MADKDSYLTEWFDQRFIWWNGGRVVKFSNKSEILFGKTPVTDPFSIKKFEDVVEWLEGRDYHYNWRDRYKMTFIDEVAPIDPKWFKMFPGGLGSGRKSI